MFPAVEMTVNTSIYYFEYVILTVQFLKIFWPLFKATSEAEKISCSNDLVFIIKGALEPKTQALSATVHQLLCCVQVEMRGLFYFNFIYIQFLSSKMRGAFDFIGLPNIFQVTYCNKRSLSCFQGIWSPFIIGHFPGEAPMSLLDVTVESTQSFSVPKSCRR